MPRGQSWGIMRCEKLVRRNYSLHAEGRALDWHLDARNPADRRAGERLIALLLAPDRAGNPHALARRMGVQEIIWDCRAWWSGAERPAALLGLLLAPRQAAAPRGRDHRPPRPHPLRAEPDGRRAADELLAQRG